ncbi:hypothetical protein JZ751_013596 [Albula glossodonta]|uniref:Uncharacterized protein n=1 Tax=Albula glossodonta TaxID=121402 RepID=A0A8T2P1A7_9TELE|nr:hypothetical protein JZ751_013596 [Albula glossodonta]
MGVRAAFAPPVRFGFGDPGRGTGQDRMSSKDVAAALWQLSQVPKKHSTAVILLPLSPLLVFKVQPSIAVATPSNCSGEVLLYDWQ